MSSIEEFNHGLDQLSERVDQHVQNIGVVSENPQFNSIAARARRASELAVEVAGLVRGVVDDTDAYIASLSPLYTDGRELEDLQEFARSIVRGTNNEDLMAVPNEIGHMSAFAVGGLMHILGRYTRPFAGYITNVERASEGLNKLAELVPEAKREASRRAEERAAQIKKTIQQGKG